MSKNTTPNFKGTGSPPLIPILQNCASCDSNSDRRVMQLQRHYQIPTKRKQLQVNKLKKLEVNYLKSPLLNGGYFHKKRSILNQR